MVIAAPLLVERLALRGARTLVVRTGMGPARSRRALARLGDAAVLVAGVGGGLAPHIRPGDVVVASEVRGPDGAPVPCANTSWLVGELRGVGLKVHCGPIVSTQRLVVREELARLAATGAYAVDMESWWLAPRAVVRAISDTAEAPLLAPGILRNGLTALRALRRTVPVLDAWAARRP